MSRVTVTVFFLVIAFSCSLDPSIVLPTVKTGVVSEVNGNFAIITGEVLDAGDSELTAIGFVAGEVPDPTLENGLSSTINDLTLGGFIGEINLRSNTDYYVRAYATNRAGTAYGESIELKTLVMITSKLEFNKITEINGYNFTQAIGFVGSAVDQSLFLAHRQMDWDIGFQSERIFKYDLLSGDTISIFNPILDYISKEIQLVNGQPVVVGSQFVSHYDIDLTGQPKAVSNGKKFSRHGSAIKNDSIYVFGGDLDGLNSDKIWLWNPENNDFTQIATMPGPKAYAAGEIVNEHLYVFGGRREFNSTQPENSIYDYSFNDKVFTTYTLPLPLYQSFTARVGDLIYVAGHFMVDRFADDTGIFFGVFNTQDNSFHEIEVNLSDAEGASIWALTAIGNDLYVVYGDPTVDRDELSGELYFTIQRAEIP